MLTSLVSSNPLALITSWPELTPSQWYLFNPPVIVDQQYPFDTHLPPDWYPSGCCVPAHLPLCTIQLPSFISCSSISIPLAIADVNQELLHIAVTMAGVILFLVHREYCNVCLHCINTPLQLWQHSRMGGDDMVKGYMPGDYWCGDSAGL